MPDAAVACRPAMLDRIDRLIIHCLGACALLLGSVAIAAPGLLRDQNGNEVGLDNFPGEPVLVYVASLRKTSQSGDWEETLSKSFPQHQFMIVADISSGFKSAENMIDDVLRNVLPVDVDVAIDADNLWKTEYDLKLGAINLLLFDADHELVFRHYGKADDEGLARVEAELAKLYPADSAQSSAP